MTLKETFQVQAMAQAQSAMLTHGCPTKRLFQNLQTYGGVETAKELARRHRLSDGFDALVNCGQTKLTLEALAVQKQFGALFTDEEINWFLEVLVSVGYY